MSKQNAALVLLLVVSISLAVHSYAQIIPAVNNPVCVPTPEYPCSGSHASSGGSRSVSSDYAMKMELASTVADIFVRWLFSSDAKANAKKLQMMAELEQRKAAAERQHKIEEAQRLAGICNRLATVLKLSGVPELQIKGVEGAGGLKLKLGDESDGQVGIKGLPGIALNDNTGNGGTRSYGIGGLPGIYVNGPSTPATPLGATRTAAGGLQLKVGDSDSPPAPVTTTANVATPVDPGDLSPQQLADLATQVANLPPDEQARLLNEANKLAQGATPVNNQTTPSHAAASVPSMAQLQQTAASSRQAASTASLDDAAALARIGFDQSGNGKLAPSTAQSTPRQVTGTTAAIDSSAAPVTTGTVNVSSGKSSATPVIAVQSPPPTPVHLASAGSEKPMVVATLSTTSAGRAAGCPIDSSRRLPTREEFVKELAGLRFRLDVLKGSLLRLNRSIQMDQQQFAEWEKETQDAAERSRERLKEAVTDKLEERFFDYAEEYYKKVPDKVKAVKRVQVLLKENDVYDWAAKGTTDWDELGDGLDQLANVLPLSKSASEVLWASKTTIDSSFDIATELVSWRQISQLQKNSDAYLAAVKQSGEEMKAIVVRIREIEDRLASGDVKDSPLSRQMPVCE